ncbi:hypothetical protein GUITHDRAFT_84416 [Guillardia theta CCMP2712]|uniref:Glycerol-3-phosphate dehydrogenase n=1 Tax=Guillardia theta (strain CCMP2712) TaxID=905079 RepID=L1JZ60_GUITC|nr:hypothetical protein GUITHDRAFT_84416 [Guillardia theta CCMP2712]EKX53383.1 hypothetical protein GUITHDRAFT_84416 [Guillardia theta CCMP2712]|eukprot:XP_005840363.1 hypothetical protein GUITHDRAFT_84416 [Guillardia theta CCMP2712]
MQRPKWWKTLIQNMLPVAATETKQYANGLTVMQCEDGTAIIPWTPPDRKSVQEKLKSTEYDILVIGGGATGSGVALDAVTRGLKVALVEQEDFASGTSSRSTKLIHGGIRYLALAFQKRVPPRSLWELITNLHYDHSMMQVVMSDLYERAFMMQSAPFMSKTLPMMIPLRHWWEVPVFWVSGKLYDTVGGTKSVVPESHLISKAEALFQFPHLKSEGLKAALVLYDGQQNDTRMNLYIALTAAQAGAQVMNHTEVLGLNSVGKPGDENYKITGAKVRDVFTGQTYDIKAKQVINATGPFTDSVRKMADPEVQEIIVPAKGSHLILPDHFSPDSMGCVWFTKDGRVLYLLPWEGSTIAGTTDIREKPSMAPTSSLNEVDFILRECNSTLSRQMNYSHVRAAWAGLRPLVKAPNADPNDTKKLARDHVVDVVRGNLISICGGKWTTYRRMAKDAVDKAVEINKELEPQRACCTDKLTLLGTDRGGLVCNKNFDKVVVTLREKYDMDKMVAKHLMHNYGTRALIVADLAKDYAKGPNKDEKGQTLRYLKLYSKYPMLEAEVVFACRWEYACTAVDVLARRTRLAFLDSHAAELALPRVLDIMQKELGWSNRRREKERTDALTFLKTMSMPSE